METLKKTEIATSFNEIMYFTDKLKNFVEVTEELYYYALGNVPPIYIGSGMFLMGEAFYKDLFYTFGEKNGKFYACLCNKSFALNNFKP